MDAIEPSGDLYLYDYSGGNEQPIGELNSRTISIGSVSENPQLLEAIVAILQSEFGKPKPVTCGAVQGYLDPEHKRAQQFEINVLLHSIHCSSIQEEQEKFKELMSFVNSLMHAAGVLTVAVFSRDYKNAAFSAVAREDLSYLGPISSSYEKEGNRV
ncbi:MAG: hypothetical protein KDK64_07110 [Chlamydiia bacterium]|nr:hypothetical protein [Chlamydiia bacterium]